MNQIRIISSISIILLLLNGCKNELIGDYPEIINKYQIQKLHDRAKWEVYKLNSVSFNEYHANYLVNYNLPDSIIQEYENLQKNLKAAKKKISQNRKAIELVIGEENVKDFIESELELFEKDSSEIFKDGEIFLSFFPQKEKEKLWSKPTGGLYYTIVFKDDNIIRTGRDDYVELDYPIENQIHDNLLFGNYIEKRGMMNPWLTNYYQNEIKKEN